jgi:polysaccharide export outer membrane protein
MPALFAGFSKSCGSNDDKISASREGNEYRIGVGDLLTIEIFNRPQLTREERVDGRGMIRLPLIDGDIQAACVTEKTLASEIARRYREAHLLKNPIVTVVVKDFQSQPVAVLGAVHSPGRFLLHRRVRLLELVVFHAGGVTPNAGQKIQILSTSPVGACEAAGDEAAVKQRNAGQENPVTYDLKELLQGNESINPYVQQGDIINIPAAEEAFIVGNVLRPGAVPIVGSVTLSQALASVGGVLPNTQKDKIKVIRQVAGSSATTELVVDLKAADRSKGIDFPLNGGDIVEVSTKGGLSGFLTTLANSAIPMATSMPVRVIP